MINEWINSGYGVDMLRGVETLVSLPHTQCDQRPPVASQGTEPGAPIGRGDDTPACSRMFIILPSSSSSSSSFFSS